MKKHILISILFLFIFGMIFQSQYLIYNSNNYKKFSELGKSKTSNEVQLSFKNSNSNGSYEIIKSILNNYESNIFFEDTSSKNGKIKIIKYVYFNNISYLNSINLNNGIKFSIDDNQTNKFLSSIVYNDQNQIGEISSFNPKVDFEIRTLKSCKNTNIFLKKCIIECKDISDFENIKKDFESKNVDFKIIEPIEIHSENTYQIYIYYSLIFLIIMIILFFKVLNSYKKIAVQKMLGFNFYRIALDIIKPIFITEIIISFLTLIIFCLFNFSKFGYEQFVYIFNTIKLGSIVLFFSTILLLLPILYTKKIKISNMIKNKKPIKQLLFFNYALKIIIAIFFVNVLSLQIINFENTYNKLNVKLNNWSKLKNYAVIPEVTFPGSPFYDLDTLENKTKFKELYHYFNSQGSILIDVSSFIPESRKENFKHPYSYSYEEIKVNPNFLEFNPIYDTSGNEVTISENDSTKILLLPEKYRSQVEKVKESYYTVFELSNQSNNEIKIIWIKDNQKIFGYNLDVNLNNNFLINEPIINVATESNSKDWYYTSFLTSNHFKITLKNSTNLTQDISEKMAINFDQSNVIFNVIKVLDLIQSEINNEKQILLMMLSILLILLSIMVLVSIQSIWVYFESNKVRLAIKKFHGFSTFDKYNFIYLSNIFIWCFISLICFLISPKLNIWIISSIMLSLEIILSSVYILINENKRLLTVTNRGI